MNKPLGRVVAAMLVLFALLIGNATYTQYIHAGTYRDSSRNSRVLLSEYDHPRGNIMAGSTAIATSKKTSDSLKYLRTYPLGPMFAPVTGFYSLVYGGTALESTDNGVLAGTDDRLALSRLSDLFTGRNPQGGNVVTTIDPKMQEVAYKAMAKQTGAVVALNPQTGAILSMVSTPSFDPSVISSHDSTSITKNYKKLINEPTQPMLDRAISNTYPPGSVFKTIISAAALKAGYKPNQQIPAPDGLPLPQSSHIMHNFDGESCGNGKTDSLADALAMSCDTAFGNLGMQLGAQAIKDQAAKFGITGDGFTMPLRVVGSATGDMPDDAKIASSSIGQQDVRLTPLQAAMIAAAIGNDGTLMKPYLVKQIQANDFSVVDSTSPKEMSQAMPSGDAEKLTKMMEGVVTAPDGTGKTVAIPGVKVAAKTGTAQTQVNKPDDAWIISFAPAENPKVAVAVFLEHAGTNGNEVTGGMAAGPIAKAVMQQALADSH